MEDVAQITTSMAPSAPPATKAMTRGLEKGRAKGKAEVARQLKRMGLPISQIVQTTGLTAEEIEKL